MRNINLPRKSTTDKTAIIQETDRLRERERERERERDRQTDRQTDRDRQRDGGT